MTFATPLGLLALLAIPAIVAIHMFRRRLQRRPVAGLFLWEGLETPPAAGRRLDRLPISWSLLLECLAALALSMILAGARLSSAGLTEHLVVLLDDSASMSAVNAGGESARDRGVQRVLREIEGLGRGARVSVVVSGVRPAVLAGPAAYNVEIRQALEYWRPSAPHHSMAVGLRLARELSGRTGRLMIVSDMPAAELGDGAIADAVWISVGEPLPNVAILAAERMVAPEEGRGTIALTFGNYSNLPARPTVTVSHPGGTVLGRDLDLPPGVSSLTLSIPPGLPPVRVELSTDALARDNAVMLAEPRPRIVAVDNRLPDGRGRDAVTRALEAVSGVTRGDPAHLRFVEAGELAAPAAQGAWSVGFGQPPGAMRSAGAPQDFVGPFLLEKRHALLHGVTLGGVVWTGSTPVARDAFHPLVSAGDQVLLAIGRDGAAPRDAVLFNIDLDRTNLIRAPDWPILISNLVEMRRGTLPGPERWNYSVGEWVRVRLGDEPKAPVRYRCGDLERALPAGRQLEFLAPLSGGLLEILEGDAVLFQIGVNFFDEFEADLRRHVTRDAGDSSQAAALRAESGPSSDPLFWILLAIGTAAILANWCLLPGRSPA